MYKTSELELNKLLSLTLERNASDLHLIVGEPPIIRVDSALMRLEDYQVMSKDVIEDLANVLLHEEQKTLFSKQQDVDLSYSFKDNTRFRVNVYRQQGMMSIAF